MIGITLIPIMYITRHPSTNVETALAVNVDINDKLK